MSIFCVVFLLATEKVFILSPRLLLGKIAEKWLSQLLWLSGGVELDNILVIRAIC